MMRYKTVKLRTRDDRFITGDLNYKLVGGSKGTGRTMGDPGEPGEAPDIELVNFDVDAYCGETIWADYSWLRNRGYVDFARALAMKLAQKAVDKDAQFRDYLLDDSYVN